MMDPFLQELRDILGDNDDFLELEDSYVGFPVVLMGFKSFINFTSSKSMILKNIASAGAAGQTFEQVWDVIGVIEDKNAQEAVVSLMDGKLIVFIENYSKYVVVEPISRNLDRSIEAPANENVIHGPMGAFNEDIETNIGLIRKEINSKSIRAKAFSVGTDYQKNISLLYYEGKTDMKLVEQITKQINRNRDKEVNNLQSLGITLEFSKWSALSKFNTTELPMEAANALLKGKVILFLDRYPFALVMPNLIWDMFTLENDRNYPHFLMLFLRLLRIIGILAAIIAPGLYVALVAVNPEVLRIEIALSIIQSREGVPYPALIETTAMLIVLDLVIEASARLPKSIGPTVTMVGGIILGQAIVSAKLVSQLLTIIVAITTISNATVVGFQNTISIRIFKYIIIILSSIYGILGLFAGIVFISAYLASQNTFGIPYLYLRNKKGEMKNG